MKLSFDILTLFIVPILIPLLYLLYAKSSLKKEVAESLACTPEREIQELPTAFYVSLNGLYILVPLCLCSIFGLVLIGEIIQEDVHRHYMYIKYDTAVTIGLALCVVLFFVIALMKIIATLVHQKFSKSEVIKLSHRYFESTSKLIGPTVKFQWDDLFFIEPIVSYKSAESIVRLTILGEDNNEEDEIIYEFNLRNIDVSIGDFIRAIEEYSGESAQECIVRW